MIAKVLKEFRDNQEKVMRYPGDTFECTYDRFGEINGTRYGILVEAVEMDSEPVEEPEPTESADEALEDGTSDSVASKDDLSDKPRRGRRGYRG